MKIRGLEMKIKSGTKQESSLYLRIAVGVDLYVESDGFIRSFQRSDVRFRSGHLWTDVVHYDSVA